MDIIKAVEADYLKEQTAPLLIGDYVKAVSYTHLGGMLMGKRFFGLLGRKRRQIGQNNGLPKAIAFVDYEHWFISMEKLHHMKPNLQAWFNDLKKKCNIVEVLSLIHISKKRRDRCLCVFFRARAVYDADGTPPAGVPESGRI